MTAVAVVRAVFVAPLQQLVEVVLLNPNYLLLHRLTQ
jgi:hypothetical protein